MLPLNRFSLLVTASFIVFAQAAEAVENLTLVSDQSVAVTLPQDPGTVVIGNPSIADVSLEGRQLFLYGKGFGATNVIVLNGAGEGIAEFLLRVRVDDPESVIVFKQNGKETRRETYSCAPNCEPTLQVGDSPAFTATTSQTMAIRSNAAREQLKGNN